MSTHRQMRSATFPSSRLSRWFGLSWLQLAGWFAAGTTVAFFVMWTQASALGGWSGLLNVGERSDLRPVIEAQLTNLVLVDDIGNDGQITYAIALDPWGQELTDLVPQPAHRWRRLLFPALAGGFGTIGGDALLWSMVGWAAASLGVAAVALRSLLSTLGASVWAMVGLLAHPGVWLGLRVMTPDPMALAFALIGMALVLRDQDRPGIVSLALAALAKEPYLVVAASLGAWRFFAKQRRRGVRLFLVPTCAYVVWTVLMLRIVDGTALESDAVSLPLGGIIRAAAYWPDFPVRQNLQTWLTIAMVVAGTITAIKVRSSLMRWSISGWLVLAIITSEWVWRFGNGNLRGFAPVALFAAVALALPADQRHGTAGRSGGSSGAEPAP